LAMEDYNPNRWQNHRPDEPEPDRDCDWPECDGPGAHRAPRDRDNLRDYFWFCLDHVRDYNKSWNYFDGMETDEYKAMTWSIAKWDRPTWPIGNGAPGQQRPGQPQPGMNASDQASHIRAAAASFRAIPDPTEMSLEDYVETTAWRRLPPEDRHALEVMGLNATATLQDIKKRYKQLVKRFHPDANGSTDDPGNQSPRAQEQLRKVIAAYSHLVKSSHMTNTT
jgi:hypothetical protein